MGNKQYSVLRRHSLPRGAICQLIGVRPVLVKIDSNFVCHRIHCKCSNRYCCLLLLLFVVFISDVDFIYDTNVDVWMKMMMMVMMMMMTALWMIIMTMAMMIMTISITMMAMLGFSFLSLFASHFVLEG